MIATDYSTTLVNENIFRLEVVGEDKMEDKVYLIKFNDRKTNVEYQVKVPIGYGSVVNEEEVEVERQEVSSSKIEKILGMDINVYL